MIQLKLLYLRLLMTYLPTWKRRRLLYWLCWMWWLRLIQSTMLHSSSFFHPVLASLVWRGTGSSHIYMIDRQTDILLTEKKSHYRLICHRNERDICTCIYKIVSLLKSYDNIHGMTYTTKIMLSGIAKIKTGYFDNINYYY